MSRRWKYPNALHVESILAWNSMTQLRDGRWVAARPLGFHSFRARLRATWLVFTGQADAVRWEGQ